MLLLYWCTNGLVGYDVCFTRRRSPVRSRVCVSPFWFACTWVWSACMHPQSHGSIQRASIAQMVERKTLNLVVVGSIPTGGALFCQRSELFRSRSYFIKAREKLRRHQNSSMTSKTQRINRCMQPNSRDSAGICVHASWVHSSAVEHGIADPAVTGSIPVVPFLLIRIRWANGLVA